MDAIIEGITVQPSKQSDYSDLTQNIQNDDEISDISISACSDPLPQSIHEHVTITTKQSLSPKKRMCPTKISSIQPLKRRKIQNDCSSIRSISLPIPPTPIKRKKTFSRRGRATAKQKHVSNTEPKESRIYFVNHGIIDRGSFGFVFKVKRTPSKNDKFYALKVSKFAENKQNGYNQCLKQVTISQKLQNGSHRNNVHPNICLLRLFFIKKQKLHQVFELCQNGNLRKFIEYQNGKKLGSLQIWNIFIQILNGLYHIHAMNIIHCDLKPENIFINDYLLKIGDFGNSVDLDIIDNCHSVKITSGDPIYIAPELLQTFTSRHNVTKDLLKIDIFGLGIILVELIENVELEGQGLLFQKLRNIDHQKHQYLDWSWFNDDQDIDLEEDQKADDIIITELKAAVNAMLHEDPSKRIGSNELVRFCEHMHQKHVKLKVSSMTAFKTLEFPSISDVNIDKTCYGQTFDDIFSVNKKNIDGIENEDENDSPQFEIEWNIENMRTLLRF